MQRHELQIDFRNRIGLIVTKNLEGILPVANIDIKQLLAVEKFLPFYADRNKICSSEFPPLAVELHWTSDCNYDCVHCSYGSRRQSKGRLPQEIIQSVIDDLVALKSSAVYLSGGGEPTLIKGWDKYAEQLINAGIEVALITNGVLLQNIHLAALARMNYVAISIYSTVEDEYHKITDSRFFDKQWTSPKLIKNANEKVIVGARCVINKTNFANVVNIYGKAIDSGYDYVIFIPAVDYEGRGVGLGLEEESQVKALLIKNQTLFNPKSTNALDLIGRNVSHYRQSDYRLDIPGCAAGCSAVRIRANAFVNFCGGIWLCQPHIGNPVYQIGNLHQNRLIEIWNSPRHHEVASLLHIEFAKGACRNCRSIAFNRVADQFDRGLISLSDQALDPFI